MKLNKKGFTLVELLAVVVILLAISVIAVSSISAAIERNKAKQNDAKMEIIYSYAKLYYEEHKNDPFINSNGCISISDLGLSDAESVYADGTVINGVILHDSGKNFRYADSCPVH